MTPTSAVFRRAAVPLAFYYGITIALPLANGAAQSGEAFTKHAAVVLVVPILAVMLVDAACIGWNCLLHPRIRASCKYSKEAQRRGA